MLLELVVWFVYHGLSPFLLVNVTLWDFNRESIFCSSHVEAVPRPANQFSVLVSGSKLISGRNSLIAFTACPY